MSALAVQLTEVAQSWRGLLRRPGYLLLAVLTLALGVATATTVFALIDQALLRPLPFPQPERLVTLGVRWGEVDDPYPRNAGAPGYYAASKKMHTVSASGMALGFVRNSNLSLGDSAEVVPSLSADRGFLQTLGVRLQLGRNFNADEDRPNGPQAVILGHAFWQQRFGGDPAVVGRNVTIEGRAVAVIGVLPAEFVWPDHFDLLLPLQPDPASTETATNQYIVGRLAPGATLAAASAEADRLMRPLILVQARSQADREQMARTRFPALALRESVFASRSGRVLWLFLAAALCVLAIAGFNLGNLMLLRALARDHASAVRAALGASPWRLALPGCAEALLLGVLGAVAGLALAWLGLRLLGRWIPPDWLRGQTPQPGAAAMLFAMVVGVVVALSGALLGLWRGRRRGALAALGREGQGGLDRGSGQLARALIVLQIVVATTLLLGAALFARSLQKLSQVPMGFQSASIVTFTLSPLRNGVGDNLAVNAQARALLEAFRREPGVVAAGLSTNLPTASQFNNHVQLPDGRGTSTQYRLTSAGWLDTFAIPLLAGRGFDPLRDRADSEPVVLVSTAFAQQYLGGDALGKLVRMPQDEHTDVSLRVIGVVGDVRQFGPAEPAPPVLYQLLAQTSAPMWSAVREFIPLRYALRVQPGAESALMRRLPELVRRVSPGQPITDLQSMQAVVAETTREQRLNLLLVGLFSALALVLAAVGLYAVMAVVVAGRRQEFGVRAALGASPSRLLGLVLGDGARQLLLGLLIGLALVLAGSRLLQRFLFGIEASDPGSIALVALVLGGAGLLACLLPGLRAARVAPMQALRQD